MSFPKNKIKKKKTATHFRENVLPRYFGASMCPDVVFGGHGKRERESPLLRKFRPLPFASRAPLDSITNPSLPPVHSIRAVTRGNSTIRARVHNTGRTHTSVFRLISRRVGAHETYIRILYSFDVSLFTPRLLGHALPFHSGKRRKKNLISINESRCVHYRAILLYITLTRCTHISRADDVEMLS